MIKKAKLCALLLSFSMLSTVFAGCQTKNTTNGGSTSNTPANSQAAPKPGNPALPIVSKPTTFKIYAPTSAAIAKSMSNLGESDYYKELEKRTGVHAEFVHPAMGQEKEYFNLMISSGDFPDILQLNTISEFPGGTDKGIADGALINVKPLVEKYAPNYAAIINSNPEVRRAAFTDVGNLPGFYSINAGLQPPWMGMVVRQDWLKDLGLKTPVTYDDWYVMLKAFKEKKGATAPFMIKNNGFVNNDVFNAGYGVALSFYQVDGKVKYGPMEKGYEEYIAMLAKWFAEGLIDKDYATKKDNIPSQAFTTTGKAGAWNDFYTNFASNKAKATDPNYECAAVPSPVKNAGETVHLKTGGNWMGSVWLVTKNCKEPEVATKWIDYTYSPEGSLLANYGVENKSFVMKDGKPQFSELITNNPQGLTFGEALVKYAKAPSGAFDYHWERELVNLPENAMAAGSIWNTKADYAYKLYAERTLTADEGAENARIMGDIETYISEMNIKFIMGLEPISKFEDFRNKIKAMNINRAIELQQASVNRFNARK